MTADEKLQFTRDWYAARIERLADLCKGYGCWDEASKILANGTTGPHDPPTYARTINALRAQIADLKVRAEAAEQRAEAAEAEVARLQGYRAEAEAAVHFAQAVAHLLASPDAEAEAVQHLRADDLPHLLECVRGRLILAATEPRWVRLRTEARPAGEVSDG